LGSLFDLFYLQPIGSVFALKAFTDKSVNPPPLTVETIARTEKFWDATAPQLATIQQTVSLKASNLAWIQKNIDARLHLQPVPPKQSRLLGQWYSVALDNWGVQLQRAGQFMPARKRFEQALALNENNLAVRVNLECNTNLASGTNMDLAAVDVLAPQVGNFQQLIRIMTLFGAMDEPSFCYLLGNAFQKSGLPRQAMQQFTRAATLAPDILAPKIALAELYTRYGLEDDAREIIDNVRSKMSSLPDKNNLEVELSLLEADSWLSQTNVANASSALESVLRQHPDDIQIANRVINAYLAFDNYTNALLLIKAQLSKTPDDVHALNTQAAILIKSGNAAAAIPVLDYVLTLTNLTTARLNRASAQLLCQNFAAAETDYHELEKSGIEPGRVSYGLATIAEHRHNTSQAANYLRFCLTNTMPGTFLWRQATARLQALEPNPATK